MTISRSLLPRTDANTLIMGTCHSRALGFYMIQHPKSLTLCWRSVDAVLMFCWRSVWGVAVSTPTILPLKAANTLIMDKWRISALGLYKMQHPKLLTLCWRSCSDSGWDHVAFSFAHQGCQYVDYIYQRANGIPMDLLTRPKTVGAPLKLTFRMCLLPCWFLFCL